MPRRTTTQRSEPSQPPDAAANDRGRDHDADDTLRILVATDNHLGVDEKDPIRGNDSFETFEEILQIAKERRADCVLLGGDLFHDNKPSRSTIVKAMDILTRYCLNDDDIDFEIVSDQSNFTTGKVNFENEHLNIGLPVFTIHGNHDDPSSVDNTSAVDILASANLVNYFGKANLQYGVDSDPHGEVKVSPILIRKGDTKLALYGLGNIRDERMCRLLNRPHGVQWARPTEYEEEWVNVFVLHQNRVAHLQGAKNIVKESHLPRWLHIVVWGHEHECIISPWKSHISGGAFSVLQPGSSVATALSEGESKKKHVFMLEMKAGKWRTVKIPLETVRPFVFDSVVLANQASVNPGNPTTVVDFLTAKVEKMIERANLDRTDKSPDLPLVRLRVDYSGFSTINPQVFAQQFLNKVANAQDILMWQKASARKKDKSGKVLPMLSAEAPSLRLEDMIGKNLKEELRLLSEIELSGALQEYVQKEEKAAIGDTVGTALEETAKDAEEHVENIDDVELSQQVLEAIEAAAARRKEKMMARDVVSAALRKAAAPVGAGDGGKVDGGVGTEAACAATNKKHIAKKKTAATNKAATKSKSAPKAKKTTATKRTGSSRKKKADEELDWGDSDSDEGEEEEWDSGASDEEVVGADKSESESVEAGDSPVIPERPAAKRPARSTRSQGTRATRQKTQATSGVPARSAALASLKGAAGSRPTRATRASQQSQETAGGGSKWGRLKR